MIPIMRLFLLTLLAATAALADIRIPGPPPPASGWGDAISGLFLSLATFFGGFSIWRRFRRNKP